MPSFGKQSQERFDTVVGDLQEILSMAILITDFSITCGHRPKDIQNMYFVSGASRVRYPNSKHNKEPSQAFDIMPYDKRWGALTGNVMQNRKIAKDLQVTEQAAAQMVRSKYYYLAGVIRAVAYLLKLEVRWGGDWDSDDDFTDNKFNDLGHFEIVSRRGMKWLQS